MNDDLLLLDSPPLAPFTPSDVQLRFMMLHERHVVTKWRWLMKDSLLRAFTDRNVTATLSRMEVDELLGAGLMTQGAGYQVHLTELGRGTVKQGVRV